MTLGAGIPARIGAHALRLVDSITELTPADAGAIVVSGSHGGSSAARYALAVPLLLACFNDAGVGKDRAGVVALQMLDTAGIAAVSVGHDSARIGDARDTWHHGTISFVNDTARNNGMRTGEALQAAIRRIFA